MGLWRLQALIFFLILVAADQFAFVQADAAGDDFFHDLGAAGVYAGHTGIGEHVGDAVFAHVARTAV